MLSISIPACAVDFSREPFLLGLMGVLTYWILMCG